MKATVTQLKNVILIHNQTIISEGLLALLRSFGKYNVIEVQANTENTALSLPKGDLIVSEININCIDGVDLLKSLKKTGVPVLVYSKTNNYECFNKLMKVGIQGYVTHQSPTNTLQKAIDTILNKETYYCQHLISQIQENNTEKKNSLRNKVTTSVKISKREKEIIRLIRRGMPSKDIGETLGISVRTVGKHRENIMRKCNVGNVTELIYFIEKNEIII
jgi:DNA-binding NarL/FixJ family response regulator